MMQRLHNQTFDSEGNLLHEEWVDLPYPPLSGIGIVAALNAVLGVWTVTDACNIAAISADHLVAEVEAWVYVRSINGTT